MSVLTGHEGCMSTNVSGCGCRYIHGLDAWFGERITACRILECSIHSGRQLHDAESGMMHIHRQISVKSRYTIDT